MTNLKNIKLKGTYYQEDIPLQNFYSPCLDNSIKYDRVAGYFRSTSLALTGPSFTSFIQNNGKIRLLCSPQIPDDDAKAIEEAYSNQEKQITNDVEKLIDEINDGNDYARIIGSFIKFGILEIKFVFQKKGLFHEKWAIFEDDLENRIYFSGSYNETYAAWDHAINSENLLISKSWDSNEALNEIEQDKNRFNKIWANKSPSHMCREMSKSVYEKIISVAYKKKDELEKELENIYNKRLHEDKDKIGISQIKSKFKKKETESIWDKAYDHQLKAIKEWKINNKKGLLEHATGSGKTFTGILALDDHFKKYNHAIVTVPRDIIQEQWFNEIKKWLDGVKIIKCGGSAKKNWREQAKSLLRNEDKKLKIVYLAVNNSAQDEVFLDLLSSKDNLFFLSDEVHSIGSEGNSIVIEKLKSSSFKLGLSATPYRMGDSTGNDRIKDCFGDILKNCVFTIADGIRLGLLSKYNYYSYVVSLNEEEEDNWESLSSQIGRRIAVEKDKLTKETEKLIFIRARIAKKAFAKYDISSNIIHENYQLKDKWLVFLEDADQIEELKTFLLDSSLPISTYHSGMDEGERKETMVDFDINGGVVLSIKCLDEGVNIPAASKALIVASSQNYRQFIQRRGRVLRKYEDKVADIYDILINPNPDRENNYIKKELQRSYIFAKDAENKIQAEARLKKFSLDAHISPDILETSIDDVITGDIEIDDVED